MLNKKIEKKQIFPALTGFRAIAAWMIFIYHFFPFKNPNHNYSKWIADFISKFGMGVDMFFVLSGFLITYRYFDKNPFDYKKYMINRFARIYPMYFVFTFCVFFLSFLNTGWDKEKTIQVILNITMLKTLFTEYGHSGISQGWTLTLEELFYLSAPLYFIIIKKNKWGVVTIPCAIFILGCFLKYFFISIDSIGGFMQSNISIFIIEFFVGIGLALFIRKRNFKPILPATYTGIFFILLYIFTIQYIEKIFNLESDIGKFIENGVLSILGIAPLLWGLIHEKTFISKILSTPFFILMGKASYVFYLIHKGFIPIFINDYIWDNKLFIFVILNILSVLLFKYLEDPINHWIRKNFSK